MGSSEKSEPVALATASSSMKTFSTQLKWAVSLGLVAYAAYNAYIIRLYAVEDYGRVIHEFDPWFNFRATQYLADNGWTAFFSWFDHRAWYPLGRPVGTTIYPGMQIAAVGVWKLLNFVGINMSLNDVCVFFPAWFGVSATILTAGLAYLCTLSPVSAGIAANIMAIIPAHLMRSVAGGFDNESVAITCMVLTFFCWMRAITEAEKQETDGKVNGWATFWGAMTGLSYVGMVAAWGGFIFVLNLLASHCFFLCVPPLSRYNSSLHRAYTMFFVIGTLGAIRVPVVGLGPLRSLEQLSGVAVFIGVQILELVEIQRRRNGLTWLGVWKLRVQYFSVLVGAAAVVASQLFSVGYFSPLTSRVRALFVKHTRTGNPLVDSVAEHQPASVDSYKQYLSQAYFLAQYGFVIVAFYALFYYKGYRELVSKRSSVGEASGRKTDSKASKKVTKAGVEESQAASTEYLSNASTFIAYYAMVAFAFANKMSRLILLLGPVSSVLSGAAIGFAADFLVFDAFALFFTATLEAKDEEPADAKEKESARSASKGTKSKRSKKAGSMKKTDDSGFQALEKTVNSVSKGVLNNKVMLLARLALGSYLLGAHLIPEYATFYQYCHKMAQRMSHPSIMFKARLQNGREIIVDDYREAYWWLRDNTPEDSRVLSWWDYGYQISGIANRTTLADGNTWNHEHIATLGRILTAPEEEAHQIARHLADYVLVWAGGGGDDLAKSPHMARIGNSVYPGLCPDDPTCKHFGLYSRNPPKPTKSMANSLLYKLSQAGIQDDVTLDSNLFKLAYQSTYGKVRIFEIKRISKKSKAWIADPANRLCDRPGSWYCPGQYPPALDDFIASRKDFKQLEDFNVEKDEASKKYQEEYMRNMEGSGRGATANKDKMPISYVGCYSSENDLPAKKEYVGSASGANVLTAYSFAKDNDYKFFAIARVGNDGHSFFFNEKPTKTPKKSTKGCSNPCADQDKFYCGCADASCGDIKPAKGETILRRWVVYGV